MVLGGGGFLMSEVPLYRECFALLDPSYLSRRAAHSMHLIAFTICTVMITLRSIYSVNFVQRWTIPVQIMCYLFFM